jgi:hypothetical protein
VDLRKFVFDKLPTHITFSLKRETCPDVTLYGQHIPQGETAKYLGIYLDRRLTWQKHIFTKRKQLGLQLHRMYWITGKKSKLSLENKLLIYKTILKPIWKYGIPLWGTASNSNSKYCKDFRIKSSDQSSTLHGMYRTLFYTPIYRYTRYVPNTILHTDLLIPTVKEEITNFSTKYREKLITRLNEVIPVLLEEEEESRRLKRFKPTELRTRFS